MKVEHKDDKRLATHEASGYRVTRQFAGRRGASELLTALIKAHRS